MSSDDSRLRAWERATAYPLTALSLLFIAVYAWPILDVDLAPTWRRACHLGDLVIWGLFCAEYLIRLSLATRKRTFVRAHWFDLAVLILPVLRPLRALRLLNALRILNRHAVARTRGRLAVYVIATTALIVLMAGLSVLEAERGHPTSNIETYPQALWWAVCTITTVGYGDLYPATVEGRLVALALMIGGLGLIGFTTGSLASWIVERLSATDRPTAAPTRADVDRLLQEVRTLRTELADLNSHLPAPTQDAPSPTREAATVSQGAPTATQDAATASQGAATASQGAATASQGAATASQGAATVSQGAPAASQGAPTPTQDAPTPPRDDHVSTS